MLRILLWALLFTLAACTPALVDEGSAPLETVALPPTEANLEWIEVYFSDPESPSAGSYRGGPDTQLAAAIARAETSVDAAIHDLNLWSVRDALLAAERRGVRVRIVAEAGNMDRLELQELAEEIEIVEDFGQGRMHNKFVVIDEREVWTGSMNFTTTGAYRNRNHLLQIESSALAAAYTAEFEEMFLARDFGAASPAGPGFLTTIQGHSLELYFSPDDDTLDRLIELVAGAQEEVLFLAFSFTSDPLAEALLEAQARGVTVRGVFEGSQVASNTGGEWDYLASQGLDIRQDGQRGEMHHKVIIIDRAIVVVGSYNFSRSAEERNDENTLVIASGGVADLFMQEFEEIWDLAQ